MYDYQASIFQSDRCSIINKVEKNNIIVKKVILCSSGSPTVYGASFTSIYIAGQSVIIRQSQCNGSVGEPNMRVQEAGGKRE